MPEPKHPMGSVEWRSAYPETGSNPDLLGSTLDLCASDNANHQQPMRNILVKNPRQLNVWTELTNLTGTPHCRCLPEMHARMYVLKRLPMLGRPGIIGVISAWEAPGLMLMAGYAGGWRCRTRRGYPS